jgi:hypothetical protein
MVRELGRAARGFPGRRPLKTAARGDVEAIMTSLSHSPRMGTWPVRQALDALRIRLVQGVGKPSEGWVWVVV